MATFLAPKVQDNPDGWGPNSVSERFKDIPFAPFSKGDKLGKAADWTGGGQQGARGGGPFNAQNDEEDFHLVDSRPTARPRHPGRRQWNTSNNQRRDWNNRDAEPEKKNSKHNKHQFHGNKKWNNMQRQRWNTRDDNKPKRTLPASIEVRPEWSVVEQIQLPTLARLSDEIPAAENLEEFGSVLYYDKNFERTTTKTSTSLKRFEDKQFYQVTTSDDPIIQSLQEKKAGNVYATDAIVSRLMASPRSSYSWDIVVTKKDGEIVFDKRDGSFFDFVNVSETAAEGPDFDNPDSINHPTSLSREATFINQNFSQQVLSHNGESYSFKKPNPFVQKGETPASTGYRYRKFILNEDTTLICRTEVHGAMEVAKPGSETQLITLNALNEFDPKTTQWQKKLDSQRGAVLATELKNNSNKLAMWTSQAVIAGADLMKLGYVTRKNARDCFHHDIIGTQFYKPREFAQQINLNVNNMWGIFIYLVEAVQKQEDGKFVYLKDPHKALLRLYRVPENAFDALDEVEHMEFGTDEIAAEQQ